MDHATMGRAEPPPVRPRRGRRSLSRGRTTGNKVFSVPAEVAAALDEYYVARLPGSVNRSVQVSEAVDRHVALKLRAWRRANPGVAPELRDIPYRSRGQQATGGEKKILTATLPLETIRRLAAFMRHPASGGYSESWHVAEAIRARVGLPSVAGE